MNRGVLVASLVTATVVAAVYVARRRRRPQRRTKRKANELVATNAPGELKCDEHNAPLRINQYAVRKLLGKGSFGQVYEATDDHNEGVAIKVLDR